MFKSMTAFGRERSDVGGKDITVEIKSVNNRYFDCSVKLPHIYAPLEQKIKQRLSEKGISRGKVVAVFQPHNYSRLRDLFEDFKTSFDDADTLILCPLYAAREACGTEVSSEMLAKEIDHAIYFETFEQIKEHLKSILNAGDLLIIMGAGDIAKLANSI
jgi:UDP-N-acetylmuramate--alanine ligase